MKYVPMGDLIMVEPVAETAKLGLIIPNEDQGDGKTVRGKVVAVNAGQLTIDGSRVKSQISVGDVVLYSRYAPIEVEKGSKIIAIKEGSIIAIIKEDK